jgi:hypothetical protein
MSYYYQLCTLKAMCMPWRERCGLSHVAAKIHDISATYELLSSAMDTEIDVHDIEIA